MNNINLQIERDRMYGGAKDQSSRRPMKILHVLDHSTPLQSGYTFRTLGILRAQQARGWQTAHMTTPRHTADGPNPETSANLTFYRTERRPTLAAKIPVLNLFDEMKATQRRLTEVVELEKPDILHAHSPVLNLLPTLKVGQRYNIPVTYEIRAFWEDADVGNGTGRQGSLRYRATRHLETKGLKQVDAIFTICEGLKSDLVTRGFSAEKITVIPNAIIADDFVFSDQKPPQLTEKYGLQDKTVIGFLGSFYHYEGLDLLIDAMAQLKSQGEDQYHLLLVGGGYEELALRAQTEQLGLGDRVTFTGRVPHTKISDYYALVDLLAYPRRSMRLTDLVTPLKPLEAMAMKKITIASDVGGHRELIEDGQTGFLFEADNVTALVDAIKRAQSQSDKWPHMKDTGRSFVETERSWARSAENYQAVYDSLTAKKAGS